MATISGINTTDTPNEGRTITNTNFTNVNNDLESVKAITDTLSGSIVGVGNIQTLQNKTIKSNNVDASSGNTLQVSREDINGSIFQVKTYQNGSLTGTVSNIEFDGSTTYDLIISGGNGVKTHVESQEIKIKLDPETILNETNQVLGVNVSSVSAGYSVEAANNVLVDQLAIGTHSTTPATLAHIRGTNGEPLKIEKTDSGKLSMVYKNTDGEWEVGMNSDENFYIQDVTNGQMQVLIGQQNEGMALYDDVSIANSKTLDVTGNITCSGNITGTFTGSVDTNADLVGDVHSTGNTTTISGLAVTTAKIADDAITSSKLSDSASVNADRAVDTNHIKEGAVTTAKLSTDAVTGDKVADDTIDSEHYITGSIDNEHLAADSVDSTQLIDGSVDNVHLAGSISMSKTNLTAASGLSLAGDSLGVDFDLTQLLPVGTILPYGGTTTPTGFFACDGTTKNRATYATLYAAIGTN